MEMEMENGDKNKVEKKPSIPKLMQIPQGK